MTSELPEAEYRRRMDMVDDLLIDVRMHRAEECVAHPLCPGRDAAAKLAAMPSHTLVDLVQSLLAACADRAQEIDNLRAQLAGADDAKALLRLKIAQLQTELVAARKDADAGWTAWGQLRQQHNPTHPIRREGHPDA